MRFVGPFATTAALVCALAQPLGATAAQAYEAPAAVAPGRVQEPPGLYQGAMQGYTPNTVKGGNAVDTGQLAALIKSQHPVLLDVAPKDRKPPSMGAGMIWSPTHRSIPGAVYLQGGGSGTDDGTFAEKFKSRVAALTGSDKARPVVTFCHPDCWGSYNAAKRLIGLGYTKVYWYRDGTEGWQADHETQTVKPDAAWIDSLPKEATE